MDKGGENNRKGESRTDLSIDCKEGNQEQNDQPLSSSELGQIELNPGTEGPTGLREDRVQQGKETEKRVYESKNPGTEGPTGLREARVQQGKENEKSEL